MRKIWIISAVGFLVLLAACSKKSNTAKVETIDGVTHIHCTETPLYPEKTVVFEEELAIKEQDETGKIQLYKPSRFTVDANDNIYISDSSDQAIKVFNQNGKYFRTIGTKGDGPGEFQSIGRIAFLQDGRLLVTDWQSRRTNFFNTKGEFLYSHKWRASHFDVYLTTNSSYTIDENIYGEKRQLLIKTYDFFGKELVFFGEFTPSGFHSYRQGDSSFAISLPYNAHSIFTGDQQQQWLYHCLNDKYLIEVYDQNGKLFRIIDRPYKPVPFTNKDAEEYWSSFGDDPNNVFAKMAKEVELPKVKTITKRLLVDDQGNLWVETLEEKIQDGSVFTAYDIFNKDGFYYAKVWCDVRPDIFIKGKMYSRVEDEKTGFRTVKRYRVIWKDKS